MSLYVATSTVDMISVLKGICADGLESIPDGSGSSHYGGPSNWIFGLDMARVDARSIAPLRLAIRELRLQVRTGPLVQTMVNRLRPGGELRPHQDGPPDHLRFHLPLMTNSEAFWWDEYNGRVHMSEGRWYGPVPYCGVMHGTINGGTTDRIHIVCDFEREVTDDGTAHVRLSEPVRNSA